MEAPRKRPEDFLELVERAKRGRLKVYIGSAAGVGKTYQMLEEAHDRRSLLINLAIQSFRFQQAALQDGFQNLSLLVTKQRLQ